MPPVGAPQPGEEELAAVRGALRGELLAIAARTAGDPGPVVLRRLWRLPALVALLLGGLFTVFVIFPLVGSGRREWLIATWSRMLVGSCGAKIRECVAPGAEPLSSMRGRHGAGDGRLLLSNHVSWLDIFAIDSLAPASFAAKSEIASWPLAGTLVGRAGTVFIERGRRRAVHAVIQRMGEKLQAGLRAAVFPEGTTSDGRRLLSKQTRMVPPTMKCARRSLGMLVTAT
jgi:1-acyl-sn-glycerol-3-phosphate acyltransferase